MRFEMNEKRFTIIGKRIGQQGNNRGKSNVIATAYFFPKTMKKNNDIEICVNISISKEAMKEIGWETGERVVLAFCNNSYYLIKDNLNGLRLTSNGHKGDVSYREYVYFHRIDQKLSPLSISDIKAGKRIPVHGVIDHDEKAFRFDIR